MKEAYQLFRELIRYYGTLHLVESMETENNYSLGYHIEKLRNAKREPFVNLGGQLMPASSLSELIKQIKNGRIDSWEDVHSFYHSCSADYLFQKRQHAFASLLEILDIKLAALTLSKFKNLLKDALKTRKWMTANIRASREKDYESLFRQMVYESRAEMEKVIGKLDDNNFIISQEAEFAAFEKNIQKLRERVKE
ncbi:MAG: DUF4954 family protein [Chitinophagaceae bacterium]|nr:DUF4954 family protein [Chitinophagaceae bacterium]